MKVRITLDNSAFQTGNDHIRTERAMVFIGEQIFPGEISRPRANGIAHICICSLKNVTQLAPLNWWQTVVLRHLR